MVCEISLTRGYVALVDDEDFDWLSQWRWYARWDAHTQGFYAGRTDRSGGKQRTVRMHRLILSAPDGIQVDHINRKGLDNQRHNLRLATHRENVWNQGLRATNQSGFTGVLQRKSGRWGAYIWRDGVNTCLGTWDDPVDAALAYDAVALEVRGEFAHLNFPEAA